MDAYTCSHACVFLYINAHCEFIKGTHTHMNKNVHLSKGTHMNKNVHLFKGTHKHVNKNVHLSERTHIHMNKNDMLCVPLDKCTFLFISCVFL
jgi:acetyltransferase-like isoleucine patch superfamily enzyme